MVGRDPDVPAFVWLAGQDGFGIMTAPALARIAAGLITTEGGAPDLGVDPVRLGPARLRAGFSV